MSDVIDYIKKHKSAFEEELFELLRIESISTDSTKKGDIKKAAEFLANNLKSIGMPTVKIYETTGNPIVFAENSEAGSDKPTVLIYGHYDVQPPDPIELWTNPPFEPTVIDNKIYARGSADDKGQAYIHIKSVESLLKSGDKLPVNVKFILEGEEEIGSPSLVPFLEDHRDLLACDMVLISDTSMFAKDTPSITYGLRGLTYMEIEVFGPGRDLHSGVYGGAVANPANVLCEIITKMKDENGIVRIPGFYDTVKNLTADEHEEYKRLPFNEEEYKKEIGIKETFGEKGFTTLERASGRPSLDVNGIWGGYQGEGAKTVLPAKAGAKVSMRLVPDQDPKEIARLFTDFVNNVAPKSVTVKITEHHGGSPSITNLDFYGIKAAAKAFKDIYKKEPLFAREGGSIPIVADFKKILGVDSVLMGFGLDSDAIHSPNEHFSLIDYHRGIETSARFLQLLPDFQS